MKVVFTCCNSPVMPAITKILRNSAMGEELVLIGVDSSSLNYGLSSIYFDRSYIVPQGTFHEKYIKSILELCEKENVDVVIPGSDEEVLCLKKNENLFRAKIVGSSYDKLKLLSDKYKLCHVLADIGLDVPNFFKTDSLEEIETKLNSLGYPDRPVLIKPRSGRGSRGLKLIKKNVDRFSNFNSKINHEIDVFDLKRIFENNEDEIKEYIFMEYLPGDKYSADVLVDNGVVKNMVLRNNGSNPKITPPTLLADIVYDKDVFDYAKECCQSLGLDDFAQVEVGRDEKGDLKLIEINGRLDASLAVTMGLNLNYYEYLLYKARHGSFPENLPFNTKGAIKRFIRYFNFDFIDIQE